MNSKQKGAQGERELASKLREYGYNTRRSVQYCGAGGESADLLGLPGIHIECKRVEKLNQLEAMAQAVRDAAADRFPAVFHRRDRCEWLVTMRLVDWIQVYQEWESGQEIGG